MVINTFPVVSRKQEFTPTDPRRFIYGRRGADHDTAGPSMFTTSDDFYPFPQAIRSTVRARSEGSSAVGLSAIGVPTVNDLDVCWESPKISLNDYTQCGVQYNGQWQCAMFPFAQNGESARVKIQTRGPAGIPAPFAPFDWDFSWFSATAWNCFGGSGRTGPLGNGIVDLKAPQGRFPTFVFPWTGPPAVGGGYLNVRLKRGGQVLAQSGMPPQPGYLAACILFADDPAYVGKCSPYF